MIDFIYKESNDLGSKKNLLLKIEGKSWDGGKNTNVSYNSK